MTPPDASAAPASLYAREVSRLAGPDVDAGACRICGERRARPTFAVAGVDSPIVVCRGCGLGRFHPMLGDEEIRSFYPEHYYGEPDGEPGSKFRPSVERVVRAIASRHISFLTRGLPAGAKVLDVGCGRGVLFGPLADRGFRVFGVEMNEDAVRGCDPRAQVRIAAHLSQAGFEPGLFDEIVIWHVLEHMPDPFDTIRECHRLLKPGGRLIVAVPNFASAQARFGGPHWFHLDAPRHLYHFPYLALRRLVQQAGFEILSSHHFSLRQNPFGWIQSALNRFGSQPPGTLYDMLHQQHAGRRAVPLATRLAMWGALVLGAPIALALSVVAAWLHTGATVHIVAIRR